MMVRAPEFGGPTPNGDIAVGCLGAVSFAYGYPPRCIIGRQFLEILGGYKRSLRCPSRCASVLRMLAVARGAELNL
jgi:hypothetical protein